MQQVFNLLIVDFQKHDAHETARSILMSVDPLKKLPAAEQEEGNISHQARKAMHQHALVMKQCAILCLRQDQCMQCWYDQSGRISLPFLFCFCSLALQKTTQQQV